MFPSGTLRYRLTLEIEADGKVHTGSGVIELHFARQGWSDTATLGMKSTVKGEAVAVDLGSRGVLFATLKGVPAGSGNYVSDPAAMVVKEFNLASSVGSLKGESLRSLNTVSARADIPPNRLPMLVRFRDLGDPTSVMLVEPRELEKAFGPGVRFARATIETTRDAVTTGVEKKLPWLPKQSGSLVSDRTLPYDHYARELNEASFSVGVR